MRTFVPRLVALTVVWLLATAALTYAAAQKISTPSTTPAATTTAAAPPALLTVPDVRRQAYTFAKGTLSDAGFAWKLTGSVRGYASNTVVAQTPAPGTQVVDTGAPTIVLRLTRTGAQLGIPERRSRRRGHADPARCARLQRGQGSRPRCEEGGRQARSTRLSSTPLSRTLRRRPPRSCRRSRRSSSRSAPSTSPPSAPPAFVVPGARREPLAEPPLTVRANALLTWLARHPKATDANVEHWLYQHAWIVAGARMGWWHGASALKILIAADDRVWALWGIGARSEAVAKHALAEVEARTP